MPPMVEHPLTPPLVSLLDAGMLCRATPAAVSDSMVLSSPKPAWFRGDPGGLPVLASPSFRAELLLKLLASFGEVR